MFVSVNILLTVTAALSAVIYAKSGADIIITYHALEAAEWLTEEL